MDMSISATQGIATPIKTENDSTYSAEPRKVDHATTDKLATQPDAIDERTQARVSANRQQVSPQEQSSRDESSSNNTPRKPKVSSEISYALVEAQTNSNSKDDDTPTSSARSQPTDRQENSVRENPRKDQAKF